MEIHSSFLNLRDSHPLNLRKSFQNVKFSDAVTQDLQRIEEIVTTTRAQHAAEGPYLFGAISIADVFITPEILRANNYNFAFTSPVMGEYKQTLLALPELQEWFIEASKETTVIEALEWTEAGVKPLKDLKQPTAK